MTCRAFADPEMILIAELNGENAGVALSLPNFNEILARVKKTPALLRLPHILWLMKTHRIDWARQVGSTESRRGFVIAACTPGFSTSSSSAASSDTPTATLGWIEESNTEIIDNSLMFGAIQQQEWRIYEKPLS